MSPRAQCRPLFWLLQLLEGSYQHVCVLLHAQQVCVFSVWSLTHV